MCQGFGAKAALRSSRFTLYAWRAPSDPIVSSCVRLLLLLLSRLGGGDAASPRAPFVVPLTFKSSRLASRPSSLPLMETRVHYRANT